jgi:hypothetical protein
MYAMQHRYAMIAARYDASVATIAYQQRKTADSHFWEFGAAAAAMSTSSPGRHFALKRAVDLNYYGSIVKNIDSTIFQGLIVQIPISTPIIIWIPLKASFKTTVEI